MLALQMKEGPGIKKHAPRQLSAGGAASLGNT